MDDCWPVNLINRRAYNMIGLMLYISSIYIRTVWCVENSTQAWASKWLEAALYLLVLAGLALVVFFYVPLFSSASLS